MTIQQILCVTSHQIAITATRFDERASTRQLLAQLPAKGQVKDKASARYLLNLFNFRALKQVLQPSSFVRRQSVAFWLFS